MRNMCSLDWWDGEEVVLQSSAWSLRHLGCSTRARKKEKSDSGKTVAGDVRCSYCNILWMFPSLGPPQSEVDPEAEVPEETAMPSVR